MHLMIVPDLIAVYRGNFSMYLFYQTPFKALKSYVETN